MSSSPWFLLARPAAAAPIGGGALGESANLLRATTMRAARSRRAPAKLEDEEERILLERRGDGGWGLPSCALDGASGGYMCAPSPLTTSSLKSLSCLVVLVSLGNSIRALEIIPSLAAHDDPKH